MKKAAVFTIVKDEKVFFPLWLKHYSQWFQPEDIYVLDHETVDGSTSCEGFQRVPVFNKHAFNHDWLRETVIKFQHKLLAEYECVVFAEADEFIAPDPDKFRDGLSGYLSNFLESSQQFVRCNGFEVIHRYTKEKNIDFNRPLMEQRAVWSRSSLYSKPTISKVPLKWRNGFHDLQDVEAAPMSIIDPDLYLVHMHFLDFKYCNERHALRHAYKLYDRGRGALLSVSNDLKREFDKRLYGEGTLKFRGAEEIPSRLKKIV